MLLHALAPMYPLPGISSNLCFQISTKKPILCGLSALYQRVSLHSDSKPSTYLDTFVSLMGILLFLITYLSFLGLWTLYGCLFYVLYVFVFSELLIFCDF